MQHLAPFVDADRRLAAMAAHPSAQPLPPDLSGTGATTARRPSPRRVPTAAGTPDRPTTTVGWASPPARDPRAEHAPGAHPGIPVPTDPEEGSLVTEYGLLAVVAATVAGVVIQWASGGALVTLFNALLRHARSLVGA